MLNIRHCFENHYLDFVLNLYACIFALWFIKLIFLNTSILYKQIGIFIYDKQQSWREKKTQHNNAIKKKHETYMIYVDWLTNLSEFCNVYHINVSGKNLRTVKAAVVEDGAAFSVTLLNMRRIPPPRRQNMGSKIKYLFKLMLFANQKNIPIFFQNNNLFCKIITCILNFVTEPTRKLKRLINLISFRNNLVF